MLKDFFVLYSLHNWAWILGVNISGHYFRCRDSQCLRNEENKQSWMYHTTHHCLCMHVNYNCLDLFNLLKSVLISFLCIYFYITFIIKFSKMNIICSRYAPSFRFSGDYVDKRDVDIIGRRKTRIIAIDAKSNPGYGQYKVEYMMRY